MAPKTSYTDDFAGVTNTSNSTTSNILNGRMPGSHFRDALPTASMVVAGMCFLFFLVIGIAQCIAGHRSEQKKRFKVSIGLSTFIMILYFAVYTADRILTEIQEKRVVMYFPFLIALETMTLFGDSLLMLFLLRAFTEALFVHIDAERDSASFLTIFLNIIAWGINLLAVANPAAFIYNLVSKGLLNDETKDTLKSVGDARIQMLIAYREITLAFYCIYLGASLIMTWISIFSLQKLKQRHIPQKAFGTGLPLMVGSLDIRSIFKLAYVVMYKYNPRRESPTVKFVHILVYGCLSVVVYGTVWWITRSREWDDTWTMYATPEENRQYDAPYKGNGVSVGTHMVPPHAS